MPYSIQTIKLNYTEGLYKKIEKGITLHYLALKIPFKIFPQNSFPHYNCQQYLSFMQKLFSN